MHCASLYAVGFVSGRRLLIVEFVTCHAVGQRAFDDVVLCHVDPRTENDVAECCHHYEITDNAVETRWYHLAA